jgi:hypothetical protein
MKTFVSIFLVLSFAFLTSCNPAKNAYKKGNYHLATIKAVEKLRKKPGDEKTIVILKQSYENVRRQDLERIKYLRTENKPDSWNEIFQLFIRLKDRQSLVSTITPLSYSEGMLTFEYVDYDEEIVKAKEKAAEYFFKRGNDFLSKGNRFDARLAYADFQKVKSYYWDYRGVDELINKARQEGMSYANIQVFDQTIYKLPKSFKDNLIPEDLTPIKSDWIDVRKTDNTSGMNYQIEVVLKNIFLSPINENEKVSVVTKEIEDGWEYVLDASGNVMKDSIGNDIKIKKYKTVTCTVKEFLQKRDVAVDGYITYRDLNSNSIIKQVPIGAKHLFQNVYASANGDINILDKATKAMLENKPVPFPSDMDMIFMAGDVLKESVKGALQSNKSVIR